jgi:uncharacterized membrane protein YedE/YeeE
MATNRSGFRITNYTLEIEKDKEAQLSYTFDWSNWLVAGDTINAVEYTVAARLNDPTPVSIESASVVNLGLNTFVELSGGQVNKTYVVTCKITTTSGIVDRRNFRLNVVARSA